MAAAPRPDADEAAGDKHREHVISVGDSAALIGTLHERVRTVLQAGGEGTPAEELLCEIELAGRDLQRQYALAREETAKRVQDAREHASLANLQHGRLVEDWNRLREENAAMSETNSSLEAQVNKLGTSERASARQAKSLQMQLRHADGILNDRAERINALEREVAAGADGISGASTGAAATDSGMELIDELGDALLNAEMGSDGSRQDSELAALQLEVAALRRRLSEEEGRSKALQETVARHEQEQRVGVVESPRGDDPAGLRRKLDALRQTLAHKDAEVDELHGMLAEMRPALESEIRDQVPPRRDWTRPHAQHTNRRTRHRIRGAGRGAQRRGSRVSAERRGAADYVLIVTTFL